MILLLEPAGLVRQDGKRPDGLTLIPFEGGRSLTWHVTVICSTADSGGAESRFIAELAASRKQVKFIDLQNQYSFQPIAVETLDRSNESACAFLDDLG